MSLVCFDTHVIIWGVRGQSTCGQEENIGKAKQLIDKCEKDETSIMIPSIVVAEVLCGLEPRLHSALNGLMHRRFIVLPFDTQAALRFAEMWRTKREPQDRGGISRSEMKADLMIIATAVAKGASCIYSEDLGLKKFAQDYIDVKPLPNIERQMSIEDI
ncbi:MAG: PIN domain-containing protein [Timaviella obliquedivisa GSE-PSE-MK23-08B]|jgi:predicted nucleic acid-binding protein|nr:PIN domain-containing protein [Timaviella obliquedivisa GSE-PSE-MK23-08B]